MKLIELCVYVLTVRRCGQALTRGVCTEYIGTPGRPGSPRSHVPKVVRPRDAAENQCALQTEKLKKNILKIAMTTMIMIIII